MMPAPTPARKRSPTSRGLKASLGLESQVVETNRVAVLVPSRFNPSARIGRPIDHDRDGNHNGANLFERRNGCERGATSGRSVFHHNHPFAGEVWPLYLSTAAVILWRFANHKRVIRRSSGNTLVQDCCGNGVRSHGEPANRRDVRNICDKVEHDLTDEWSCSVIKAELPKVDVIGGLFAAGQREIAVEDGLVRDVVDELGTWVGHVTIVSSIPRDESH